MKRSKKYAKIKSKKADRELVIKCNDLINEIIEPKINGIDKNKKIVTAYIGCLTIPYNPVSITF